MTDYYRDATTGRFVESPAQRSQLLLGELYRAFDFFNDRFMENDLPKVVITIQEAGRRNALGWFGKSFWSDRVCGDGVSEINFSAEFMYRSPEAILETLLHEMAHLKNAVDGVRDCTSGQYHNKHFKNTAEKFGLTVERGGNKGYAFTSLDEEGLKAVSDFNPDKKAFSGLRRKTVKPATEKRYMSLIVDRAFADLIASGITRTGLTQKQFVEFAISEAAMMSVGKGAAVADSGGGR